MGEGKIVARTYPAATSKTVRDATLNDSDKSFTVPPNKRWNMLGIYSKLTTSATVGNRILKHLVSWDGTNYLDIFVTPNIAASTAYYIMESFNGVTDDFGTNTFSMVHGMAPCILESGGVIRICDSAAIDPAADDLTIFLLYEELDV